LEELVRPEDQPAPEDEPDDARDARREHRLPPRRPPARDAAPAQPEATPGEAEAPSVDDAAPSVDDAAPSEDDAAPSEDDAAPVEDDAAPSEDDAAPAEDDAAPSEDDAAPVEDDAARAEDDAARAEDDAAPVEDDAAPVEDDAAPAEGDGARAAEAEADAPLEHSLVPRGDAPEPPVEDGLVSRVRAIEEEYEELCVLGRGGMGVVALARERATDAEVALKRLRPGADAARFLREARTVAALEHPAIVRLHRVVAEDSGEVALVLQYVPGPDLAVLVRKEGPPRLVRALEVAARLAEALAYAHDRGVVHRDVKPGNVLLKPDGEPCLTDFGLALQPDLQSLIDSSQWCGTLDYMAPEQRRAADRVDGRADVYGLGATLYHLITGSSPRVIREARIPAAVRALVLRCVEEDPRARFADMGELTAELRRAIARVQRDESGVQAPLERAAAEFRRRLKQSARNEGIERLAVAASGLAAMGLLPADAPRRLKARLGVGEPWEDELERLVTLVSEAAAARPPAEASGLLADAHALLATALRPVELSPAARRTLRRLARRSRTLPRPDLASRLAASIGRLVRRGALGRSQLTPLADLARTEEAAAVLERLLTLLRERALEEPGEQSVHLAAWQHGLRDLAAALPEDDLARRIEQEQLAARIEALASEEEGPAGAATAAEEEEDAEEGADEADVADEDESGDADEDEAGDAA